MTDQQLINKANGIMRIKQAIKNCDLPVSEVGTIFTPRIRFKHVFINPLREALENTKCKHEYVMSADSFESPYCKHCYKGA
jgi:hypothetical protein